MEEGERLGGASWNALTALPALRGPASGPLSHPRTPQSPALTETCGGEGRGEGGRATGIPTPGKAAHRGQVRPSAPRRGPNALSLRDQGGGAPEAGEEEEGGSAEH